MASKGIRTPCSEDELLNYMFYYLANFSKAVSLLADLKRWSFIWLRSLLASPFPILCDVRCISTHSVNACKSKKEWAKVGLSLDTPESLGYGRYQ